MAAHFRIAFYTSLSLLAAYNVAGNLGLADALYVTTNLAMAVLVLWVAARAGATADDAGLLRDKMRDGLRVGAAVAAVMVVILALGVLLPPTRAFFEDERAADMSFGLLLYHIIVRIPLGTAVFEEVAFRGVLYGVGKRVWSAPRAAVVSSALFGLWHILPTLTVTETNLGVADTAGSAVAVTAGVLGTFVAGLFFVWVRERADSLVAPIIVHAVINSVALTLAFMVV